MRAVIAVALIFTIQTAHAANCVSGTPITTTGGGSCTVPSGVTSISGMSWGGGSSANGWLASLGAGAGGGYCKKTLSVTPGSTIFFNVAAAQTGTTGAGTAGNNSWFNISSNAQPTAGSQGCFGQGGTVTPANGPAGGAGNFGDINFSGGSGATGSGGGAGGGGGAGSGGNGSNGGAPPGMAGGAGGSPDGGAGGNGSIVTSGSPGTAPGGGGGYGNSVLISGGNGAAGEVEFTFSVGPQFNPATFFPLLK
jgi:hypothetical protein